MKDEKNLKILLIGDDHIGHQQRVEEVKTKFNLKIKLDWTKNKKVLDFVHPHLIFHLGDIYSLKHYKKLLKKYFLKLWYVKGNHDFKLPDISDIKIVELQSKTGNIKFLLNHGTKYWKPKDNKITDHNFNFDLFNKDFKKYKFDILLCGNSHHQKIIDDKFKILNPGSLTLAKMYSDYPLTGNFMVINWNVDDKYKSTVDCYSIYDNKKKEIVLTKTISLIKK